MIETLGKLTYALDRIKESHESVERLCRAGSLTPDGPEDVLHLLRFRTMLTNHGEYAFAGADRHDFEVIAKAACERHDLPLRIEYAVTTFLVGLEQLLTSASRLERFASLFVVPNGSGTPVNEPGSTDASGWCAVRGIAQDGLVLHPLMPVPGWEMYRQGGFALPARPLAWYSKAHVAAVSRQWAAKGQEEREQRERRERFEREEQARLRAIHEDAQRTPEQHRLEQVERELAKLKAKQQTPAPVA